MKAKKRKVKRSKPINYDIGPAYSATSKSRSVADKKYHHKASGSGLDSKLYQNPDGSYTRKSVDSSPAEYKKVGKIKKKGTYGVEVDGKEYQLEGKRVEKRGGRVTKFKAKGEGDGFKIKIKDVDVCIAITLQK